MMEGTHETQNDPADAEAEHESASEDATPSAETQESATDENTSSEDTLDPVAEAQKWRDVALRSQAELENFRKRMSREKQDAIKFGNAGLLESLLPVIDNFRFGLNAARQESEDSIVFQGMSMVMKQMDDFLSDQGVIEVPAEGQVFNPNLHEAVKQEYSEETEEGTVTAVIRRGFKLHDRLLRAAHVVVSKGPEPEVSPAAGEETDQADGEPTQNVGSAD
ncbi:MAG: nucleotide exchange factor GrpE [Verrucomicrobiota bacterium]